mgnify:CR=1 FL=1
MSKEEEFDLYQEFAKLEQEFTELEEFLYDELDSVTANRAIVRKNWVKDRLETLRAELFSETIAEA